jgi:hypothetical protein
VFKISGLPYRAKASRKASTQNLASMVFDSRQASKHPAKAALP